MEQMYLFEDEEWREIEGYAGYEVSNLGRVKSRWKQCGNHKRIIGDKWKMQKQHLDRCGYCITTATGADGVQKHLKVHRLVAKAFIPNPKNLPQVNHKDENKQNNNVSNLEWCDAKYNTNYGTGLKRGALKKAKQVDRYDLNGHYIDSFESAREAIRQTKIRQIGNVCLGLRNQAGGYIWRYHDEN